MAYHYHYRLDYIDTLELDEVKMLIDYVMPKKSGKQMDNVASASDERLNKALAMMQKARDEVRT